MGFTDHQKPEDVVVGAGSVYIADVQGDGTPGPYRYLGDSDGFSTNTETTQIEHWTGDGPVAEKMVDQTVQINQDATIVLNEVRGDNVALGMMGIAGTREQEANAAFEQVVTGAEGGDVINLGATSENPAGVKNISGVVVDDGDVTTYVEGTDYEVDTDLGEVYIIPGGDADGVDITITATVPEESFDSVASSNAGLGKKAIKYVENASKGVGRDIYMPYCDVRPEGETQWKSRDSIQQITITASILLPPTGGSRIIKEKRAPIA